MVTCPCCFVVLFVCVFCDSFLCSIYLLLQSGSLSYILNVYYKCDCSCIVFVCISVERTKLFSIATRLMQCINEASLKECWTVFYHLKRSY